MIRIVIVIFLIGLHQLKMAKSFNLWPWFCSRKRIKEYAKFLSIEKVKEKINQITFQT